MGDVADILGMSGAKSSSSSSSNNNSSSADQLMGLNKPVKAASNSIKDNKPKGMSREVFGLLGKDGLAPAAYPAQPAGAAFKQKWVSSLKGKWVWTKIKPFSARR